MDWLRVTVYTTSEGIDPVTGRLYQLGITGLEIEDEKDFKDFLENNTQYWDYVDDDLIKEKEGETCVKAYVSDDINGRELLAAINGSMQELKSIDEENAFGRLEMEVESMNTEDWANNWKAYFKPLPVGDKLLICPTWETPGAEAEGRQVLWIDPGMAFGTGGHDTTRLVLEQLQRVIIPGTAMLDVGCGSGILAIAGCLLGVKTAVGVDIDKLAVKTAIENGERNGLCSPQYTVFAGDLVDKVEGQYDLITANIVADAIIALSPAVRPFLKPGGTYIVSGIIDTREDEVVAALSAAGFTVCDRHQSSGWLCLTCTAKE